MIDKVEHRGIEAFQSIFYNYVTLVENGDTVKYFNINKQQTEDDMKRLIDVYLESKRSDKQ